MPTLWGRASSVNVQKVMWALAECGAQYERVDAGGKYGRTDTDEYGEMNPTRRVPTWQEGELTLWESNVILRHLARGPTGKLMPHGDEAAAIADQWMEFASTSIQPSFLGVFFQKVRFRPEDRSEAILSKYLKNLTEALRILDQRLANSAWLAGDSFSIADIASGAMMYRYYDMEIERMDLPALKDWYDRLAIRPAYRQIVMTSYDELRPS